MNASPRCSRIPVFRTGAAALLSVLLCVFSSPVFGQESGEEGDYFGYPMEIIPVETPPAEEKSTPEEIPQPPPEKSAAEPEPTPESAEPVTSEEEKTAETTEVFVDPMFGIQLEEETEEEWTSTVDYGGEIRSRLGIDVRNDAVLVVPEAGAAARKEGVEDVVDWRNSFDFWTRLKLARWAQVYIELYAEHAISGERNEDDPTILVNGERYRHRFFMEIKEAYGDFYWDSFDLRVGLFLAPWGTVTVNSPVDRVNPADQNAFYWTDVSGTKQASYAVRARFLYEGFTFEGLLMPFFTPRKIDLYGGDFGLFQYAASYAQTPSPLPEIDDFLDATKQDGPEGILATTAEPDANPVNAQAGARITGSHGGFDYGISYLYAYEELPRLEADPLVWALSDALRDGDENLATAYLTEVRDRLSLGATTEDFVVSHYRRKHSIGTEFGTTIWDFGVKAEGTWLPQKLYYTPDTQWIETDTVKWAAGLEYLKTSVADAEGNIWLDQLFLSVEVFGSNLYNLPDGVNLLNLTKNNLGLYATARIQALDEHFELEVVHQIQFATKEFLIVPRVTYEVVQNLRLTLGALFLESWMSEPVGFGTFSTNGARQDTLFGKYSQNDQVFVQLRWNF